MIFKNRAEGGKKLGQLLASRGFEDPIVIGLPRGGLVTALEVSRALKSTLDVLIVRKIGSPIDPEYGIGALSEDEQCFFSPGADFFDIAGKEVQAIIDEEKVELHRRIKMYRNRELISVSGRTVIVVDDGLATGVTATAAIKYLKRKNPAKIIFAVPVGPQSIRTYLKEVCDEIIILTRPQNFTGIGIAYEDFRQVSDDEVIDIMNHNKGGDSP